MKGIAAVQETIDVEVVDHLIDIQLGDETSDSPAYSIRLEPTGALQLANKLITAIEQVLPAHYDTPLTNPFAGIARGVAQISVADLFKNLSELSDGVPTANFVDADTQPSGGFDLSDVDDDDAS